ncbi:hypothetical protein M8J77_021914 [Diaphorina citri]|nr:hypothetical protein M8J77_021914 [Diaphorina citri]
MLKTWKIINDLMDRKIKEPIETKLKHHFQTQDLRSLANKFNKNFIDQIKEIKHKNKGTTLDIQMVDYQPHNKTSIMYLRKATEKDVHKILKNMKKAGKGFDGLRNRDIIENPILFTPLITKLINSMIKHSVLPDKLKTSSITPLYKKGKHDVLGNYRPVGSLPIIEKVLEKHINIQTKKYLDENDVIPKFQHGFQSNKSTITLLQEFSDQINTALDQRKCVIILLLDLSFAFDTIDHSVLIRKFKEIGMCHPILEAYLQGRKQVTRIGQSVSDEEPVNQGLCQGGINSPTWYNIYTYDVKYLQRTGTLRMFADDSCIVACHKDVETAVKIAQNDFVNLQKYLYNNHIYLNEKKTEALVMGYMSKRINMNNNKIYCHSRQCLETKTYETATCSCHQIDYKEDSKYLGITIDNEFKMKKHVYNLCKKLRILKYKLIKINAGNLPLTTKRTIYFSLIDSLLRYGATLYTLAPQYVLDPLNTQQRKIKNILFNQIDVSCLTPDELAIFVLISLNFHEEKYRQLRDQPYALRTQRFRRPHVYTIQYGERRLEYIIPTLLNTYCQEFIDETNKDLVKTKIKKSILSKRS